MNRWRGQIGLEEIDKDELDQQIKEMKSEFDEYLVFDATGTGSGQMTPPFAKRSSKGALTGSGTNPPITPGKVTYDAPEGWTPGKTSFIVHARLTKKAEDSEAQITIVKMPADANKWKPNVTRWAEQVGLSELPAEEIEKRTTAVTIGNVEGKLVDLIDLESDSPDATIAAMIKRNGSAWFLKLSGEKQIVQDSRKVFDQFLKTIQFK